MQELPKTMMTWNPAEYARNSGAQKRWAEELLARLELKGREAVLDLGCGDGKITAALAQALPQGRAIGIDNSEEMIRYAQAQYPALEHRNLAFRHLDVQALDYATEFDVIFSNAALHWVQDHRAILAGAHRALRRGGRLAWSFGGKGNAGGILKAGFAVIQKPEWREFFQGFENPYFFYGAEEYRHWLDQADFIAKRVELVPKDMVHRGREGLEAWMRTTWMPITCRVPESRQADFVHDFASEYLANFPSDAEGRVHVQMVRLEVEAIKAVTSQASA